MTPDCEISNRSHRSAEYLGHRQTLIVEFLREIQVKEKKSADGLKKHKIESETDSSSTQRRNKRIRYFNHNYTEEN